MYDPISCWKQIKLAAIMEGGLNSAERISVPMPALSSGGQQPVGEMVKAFPVLRDNRTAIPHMCSFSVAGPV